MAQQDRISILVALEGADASLKEAIASARQSLSQFGASARQTGDAVSRSMEGVAQAVTDLRGKLLGLVAAYASLSGARQLVDLAEQWQSVNARIELATASQQEYQGALSGTLSIAQRLGTPLESVATVYGKMQQAVRGLGLEQRDALAITEGVSQALRISGATASESSAALLQFGQAMASGVLRGDEFNSVMENAPRLARALADGLGVSTGKLRQMAEAGQLTADVVSKALLGQSQALQAEYAQLPQTVGQSLARLGNAFMAWVGNINDASGATSRLAAAIGFVAQHFDAFAKAATALAAGGLLILAQRTLPALIASLRAAAVSATATSVAVGTRLVAAFQALTLPVNFATAALGRFNVALGVVGAGIAGFQAGQWLREQFDGVRKAGDYLGATLGAMDGSVRAALSALGRLAAGDVRGAVQGLGRDVQAIASAWQDTIGASSLAGKSLAELGTTAGASLKELQSRIAAVRLGLDEAASKGLQTLTDAAQALSGVLQKLDTDIGKSTQQVQQALSGLAAVRAQQTAALDAAMQEREAQLQRQAEALQVQLQTSNAAIGASIAQQNALLIAQTQERARLQQQATEQTLALLAKEDAARLASAALEGKTLQERQRNAIDAENAILQGRLAVWQQAAAAFQKHIDTLIGEEQRHLLAAAQLQQQRLQVNASIEDKIRDLQRQTMTEAQALQDRYTQAQELASQARHAIARGEFDKAREYAEKSAALYEQVGRSRGNEGAAIEGLKQAQTLLNQAIEGEEAAHKKAAAAAAQSRQNLQQQLAEAKKQIDELSQAIAGVQTVKVTADTAQATQALADLQKLIPQRDVLLKIQADVQAAQQGVQQLIADIKAGKAEIAVGADVTAGRKALDELKTYAQKTANLDLQLKTDAAIGAIDDVKTRIATLSKLQTESQHLVKSNAADVRRDIDSLQGRDTRSTHTITVQRVEAHAAGGVVGSFFKRLAGGGRVHGPGTDTSDSIPALLSRGEFVVRAAAVRQVGVAFLEAINAGFAPPRLAAGGLVGAAPSASAAGTPIHLHFGDRQVGPLYASDDVAAQLKQAALMFRAL